MISQSIQLKQRFIWESQEPCYSVDRVELKEIFGTWYKMNMVSNGDEPTHSLQLELDEEAAAGRDTWSSCSALLMAGNTKQTGPLGHLSHSCLCYFDDDYPDQQSLPLTITNRYH